MAIAAIVVIKPRVVASHPTNIIRLDGQSVSVKFTFPISISNPTPNDKRVNTMPGMINPETAPRADT